MLMPAASRFGRRTVLDKINNSIPEVKSEEIDVVEVAETNSHRSSEESL